MNDGKQVQLEELQKTSAEYKLVENELFSTSNTTIESITKVSIARVHTCVRAYVRV